jgi:hypothetical protein
LFAEKVHGLIGGGDKSKESENPEAATVGCQLFK